MGIIFRQSLTTSVVAYIGMAIGALNMVWLFPKFLDAGEIGLIRVLQDIPIVFAGLTHLGTLSVTDRLFPRFNNHGQKHFGLLPFSFLIYFGFFILYCLLFFFLKQTAMGFYQQRSPQIVAYFSYTIPLTFFILYQLALDSYARVHFRIVMSGFLREVFLRTATAALVLGYFLQYIDFGQLLSGLVGTYGLIVLALMIHIHRQKFLYWKPNFDLINRNLLKELLYFYFYVVTVGFSRILISRMDILMMPALLSTKAVGIYSIALFVSAIIELPRRAVNQASTPVIAQAWASGDLVKIQQIYQKSSLNQLILAALLFLGIWCNVDSMFAIMPKGEIYESGKYVVLLIGLTRLLEMTAGISDVVLIHSRHRIFNTFLVIGLAVLLFATNLLLIPRFGITGAALATFLSILAYTVAKCGFLWFKFRLQPFTRATLWTLAAMAATFILANAVPKVDVPFFDVLLRSGLIVSFFLPIVLAMRVSEELNEFALRCHEFAWRIFKRFTPKHGGES